MKRTAIFLIILFILFSCGKKKEKQTSNSLTMSSDNFTVSFEYKDYEKKYGTCIENSDCAEVKIHYPQLLDKTDAALTINKAIMFILLNEEDEEMHYKSFDEITDSIIAEYKSVQNEFKDYNNAWFIHKNLEITGIVGNYLSLKNEVTMYTGGANSYYNVDLIVFDLRSGNRMSLDQFIRPDKMNELLNIGEQEFRRIKKLPSSVTIDKSGYWFENGKFYLPNNFSISDSGFVFFFNLYEIAPRSEGYTELFIPKDKLKDLLQNDKIFSR